MKKNNYEKFHNKSTNLKRIINRQNFTYFYTIRIIDPIIKKFQKTNIKVLDVGCGTGSIDLYLAKHGCTVSGIDISAKAIKIAKSNTKKFNLGNKVKFILGDIQQMKIKETYDLIICSEIIEHIKNEKKVLLKIKKMLNENGRLVISVPSKNSLLYKLGLLNKFDKEVGHLRRYSKGELIKLLEKLGFEIVSHKKTESFLRNLFFTYKKLGIIIKFIRGPFINLFMVLDKTLALLFGESQIFIVATLS